MTYSEWLSWLFGFPKWEEATYPCNMKWYPKSNFGKNDFGFTFFKDGTTYDYSESLIANGCYGLVILI